MKSSYPVSLFVLMLFLSHRACAQNINSINTGNTSWILTATALVLLMTLPGLALFYGGLVRSKNVLSVLMQCFSTACIASLLWFLVGYSLVFTKGNPLIGGVEQFFFARLTSDKLINNLPETVFIMFQMTFAIITPALIIGSFAERMRFCAVIAFISLWLLLVYFPVAHWIWGGGWLSELGVLDFAGGIVVHATAGISALVCACVLGRRKGYGKTPMPPHNMTMTITGAGMLWVGWFGFNAGSALAANSQAGMALLVTHLSASIGALTWIIIEWLRYGKPSALGAVTGMVAGLGSITPASGYVGPSGAVVIGLSSAWVCFYATLWLKQVIKVDDALDVFSVHGVGGIIGTLGTALFASQGLGIFSGQGLNQGMSIAGQFLVQLIAVSVVVVYSALLTWFILRVIGCFVALRVSDEAENEGLDISSHNESGYDL